MSQRTIKLTRPAALDPDATPNLDLRVTRLEVEAAISAPYVVRLEMEHRDGGVAFDDSDLDGFLSEPWAIDLDDGREPIHGVPRHITMRDVRGEGAQRVLTYAVELAPRIAGLDGFRRSRIFQEMSLGQLVQAVFSEADVDPSLYSWTNVGGSYPTEEYVVQYEESDWDFLNRRLEHYGVHYHFAQGADAAVMGFGDADEDFPGYPGGPIAFHPEAEADDTDGIWALSRRLEPQTSMVMLREYNWRTPMVGLQAEAAVDTRTGSGLHYLYGEHFKSPTEGHGVAQVRAQEIATRRDVLTAKASVPGLWPGMTFELQGHPIGDLDRGYLVTAMRLFSRDADGSNSLRLTQELTLVPFATGDAQVYRPPRRTPKPQILGLMHGRVDGVMEGTAAPIDAEGRYKVLFPFDLIGAGGGRASRWIRVAQPSSGPGYGMHFPLHVGAEVVVAHLDGDPDRPVIVGSPHNALTKNPVTEANPTQSQIRTQAGVRILIDDDC